MLIETMKRARRATVLPAIAFAAGAFVVLAPLASAVADEWTMDPTASVVRFTYDHFGLSRQSGQFRDMTGKLRFSPTAPEQGVVEVTIKAAAVSTGNEALDRLLRSPDFFNAAAFPTMTFRSTGVTKAPAVPTASVAVAPVTQAAAPDAVKQGETPADKPAGRTAELRGELTMLGVTKPVTLNVVWNYTGEYPLSSINPAYMGKWVSGFSARGTILRSQWGMQRGIPLLSDEIELAIEVEFLKVSAD